MKVENNAIKKYKRTDWFDRKKLSFIYGIDMVMIDNESYHCLQVTGKPLLFEFKADADNEARRLNKELKDKRSVASKDSQRTNAD